MDVKLTYDRTALTVTVAENAFVLEPRQVDALIALLGRLRAQLTPRVPIDPPTGENLEAMPDPHYRIGPEPLIQGSRLLLRHPGYGWLAFVFRPHELKNLHRLLTAQLESQESDAQGHAAH